MPRIIVPIGYPAGVQYPVDGDEEPTYNIIITKDQVFEPSGEFYAAWSLLFSDPEAHQELRFTKDHLLKLARKAGIEEAPEMYDMLEDRGLLTSFEVDKDSSIDFLKKHRMSPQGIGLGNSIEDPTMFRIQVGDNIAISLMYDLYVLWMGAEHWSSMWDIFQSYSRQRGNVPLTNEQLIYLYAASVPGMVSAGVAFLTWSK